jgi:hypothetical protein
VATADGRRLWNEDAISKLNEKLRNRSGGRGWRVCNTIAQHFSQAQFFAGQLVYKDESFVTRWLHNHTVFELQHRLCQIGRAMLILPIQF